MKKNMLVSRALRVALVGALLALVPGVATAAGTLQWPAFRGGEKNGLVNAATPRTAAETEKVWKSRLKGAEDWTTNVSDPLIIDNDIYIAVGDELRVIDAATGAPKTTFKLDGPVDFTCRMVYANSTLFVPLPQGRLEAVSVDPALASPLAKKWITEALPNDPIGGTHQSQATLLYASGNVYMGTACADFTRSYSGTFRCFNADTGEIVWSHDNAEAGYYWSGGTLVGDAFVFAGDDGILTSIKASTGTTITPTVNLGAGVRSTVVSSNAYVFAVSQDGTLHRATVTASGSLEDTRSVSFAGSSTSTPVVYDGKVYVGGATATWTGSLSVIDVATMAVEKTIDVPAAVQGSPIVSTGNPDGAYVYFTANSEPGGIYAYKVGGTSAEMIYAPTGDEANYAMSTPAVGENGTIYYTNDSGYLFALGVKDDSGSAGEKDPVASVEGESEANNDVESNDVQTGEGSLVPAMIVGLVSVGVAAASLYRRRDVR